MSWVKLDDGFFRHPKAIRAGRDARDMYIAGLCYCASNLTDGFIHSELLKTLGSDADVRRIQPAADRLVSVGLWEVTDNGYLVHDYLEYNPTKEKALETREARAEAGRRGGVAKASKMLANSQAKPKQNPSKSLPRTRTPSPEISPSGEIPPSPPTDSKSKPYDLFLAMCDEAAVEPEQIRGKQRDIQLAAAKRLVDGGAVPEDIRHEMRWLSGQAWVNSGVDMVLLEKQRAKWVMSGRPSSVPPQNGGRSNGQPDWSAAFDAIKRERGGEPGNVLDISEFQTGGQR